jgi:transcriptional regulator with XRE-family HTH domain/Zn-dependent peptidase ImmA (M78 family)
MNKIMNWDRSDYQQITSVEVKNNSLLVEFEDGSRVDLELNSVLPPYANNADWNLMQFNPYEIIIPTSLGETEIPWSTIRLLSDADFAAHWARRAEVQAKDIGIRIKELRKSRNLTSKEVAERAGISPQSLSRIEKGYHDVVFTTLRKILAAMGCSLQDLASIQVTSPSFSFLFKRLETVGIKKEWLIDRILPNELLSSITNADLEIGAVIGEITNNLSKIYHWSPEQVIGTDPLVLNYSSIYPAKFKTGSKIQEKQTIAYAMYAHYLSLLVINATEHLTIRPIPNDIDTIRYQIAQDYGPITFTNVLNYVWDHGIPVIPLADTGTFHGACWKMSDRYSVVLKQVTRYQGRWLFDLAHELGHILQHLSEEQSSIIETDEISPFNESDEEWEASEFASNLLFGRDVEKLAELCVEVAQNKVEKLKSAVIQVAANEHVPIDILANYMAFRLNKTNNINWWGAANNLQITETSPWLISKQMLLKNIRRSNLSEEDFYMLLRALDE